LLFPSATFGTPIALCEGVIQSSYKLNPTGENNQMKKEQGFSLIELLIVVAIIAIIAAIAVPSMLTARMAANEAGAIQGCRTVGSAEMAFAAVNNQQFTNLAGLVGGNFVDSRFSGLGFNGYKYTDELGTDEMTFVFDANPVASGSTGRYDYVVDESMVVRYGENAPTGLASGDAIGQIK
jgi:prepilin-type N-terminal cleavage/methylation domain-containing protein